MKTRIVLNLALAALVAAFAVACKAADLTAPSPVDVTVHNVVEITPAVGGTSPTPNPQPAPAPPTTTVSKCKLKVDEKFNTLFKAQNDVIGATSVDTILGDALNVKECTWEVKSLDLGFLALMDGPFFKTAKPVVGNLVKGAGLGQVHFWMANNGTKGPQTRFGRLEFTCTNTGEKWIMLIEQAGA